MMQFLKLSKSAWFDNYNNFLGLTLAKWRLRRITATLIALKGKFCAQMSQSYLLLVTIFT